MEAYGSALNWFAVGCHRPRDASAIGEREVHRDIRIRRGRKGERPAGREAARAADTGNVVVDFVDQPGVVGDERKRDPRGHPAAFEITVHVRLNERCAEPAAGDALHRHVDVRDAGASAVGDAADETRALTECEVDVWRVAAAGDVDDAAAALCRLAATALDRRSAGFIKLIDERDTAGV